MAAYGSSRDGPLEKKRKKVVAWSEEEDVSSPDPFAWVSPASYYLAKKMEQARRDQESAPGPVKIPTLDDFRPPTRFHTAELFSVRESGSKAVLSAAKSLLGVSSSLVGEPLRRCSGFWVDWDEEKKTGLVLTTARLIRTKDAPHSVSSGGEEYAPRADYDNGGPVIDLNGKVVGMVNNPERFGSFIPSSILLNCLDSWKKCWCIARPHLGMTFKAVKLLQPAHVDMLWRMCDIDGGLVVQEVSKGSNAEIHGIQEGDLIESMNGKCISTTIELENTLMSLCKSPSDSQNGHNAKVCISVSSVLSYSDGSLGPCDPFLCNKVLALRNVLC